VRPLQAQHHCIRAGERVRSKGPEDHPPTRPIDQWRSDVRPDAEQGADTGGADTGPGGEQTVRVPRRRQVSRGCGV